MERKGRNRKSNQSPGLADADAIKEAMNFYEVIPAPQERFLPERRIFIGRENEEPADGRFNRNRAQQCGIVE
jgi:hypothetical protein